MIRDLIFLFFIWGIVYLFFWTFFKNSKISILRMVSSLTIAIIILYFIIFPSRYYQWNSFNKEKWRTDTDMRFKMSKDLMSNCLKVGMHKSDVVKLLGKGTDCFKDRDSIGLYYCLGQTPAFFIKMDSDFLGIDFKDSLVVSFSQFED